MGAKLRVKRWATLCAMLLAVLSLSACAFDDTVEDLFALPQLPVEYTGLNQQIEKLCADGYESIAPAGGTNLQSLQMVSLEGDDSQDAVAFFRRAQDEKPLKIMVFEPSQDSYVQLCTIESSGSSIESVYYEDLTGDGRKELVVGWKIGIGVQTVAVYSIGREAVQLMSSSYSRFTLRDLNGDGVSSIIILRSDSSGLPVAEAYSWQLDIMTLFSRCSLSSTMVELGRGSIVNGFLADGVPAIFATGVNDQGMAMTDLLIWQEGTGMVNAAVDAKTGKSALVQVYRQLAPQDIDGDGVTEIPCPDVSSGSSRNSEGGDVLADWRRYDRACNFTMVGRTYHCQSYGWYFLLPERWWRDTSVSEGDGVTGESQAVLTINGEPVLIIYTLTGENRESRAAVDDRFVVRRQLGTVYAAQLVASENSVLTEDQVRHRFYLISNTWISSAD